MRKCAVPRVSTAPRAAAPLNRGRAPYASRCTGASQPRALDKLPMQRMPPFSMQFASMPVTLPRRTYASIKDAIKEHFGKPENRIPKKGAGKSSASNAEEEDDGDKEIPVEIDPEVKAASMKLKVATDEDEILECLKELLRLAEDLEDIPDMLLDLKMDERLEELLSHENEVIQRHAYAMLLDVEYSNEIMEYQREDFLDWIEDIGTYQAKLSDPLTLAVNIAVRNALTEDADLREDSEMGVELDEDLFEEFIEDVLRNVGPALKVKLLERLRDVTQATTDWTKEDVAVMDITKFMETIGFIPMIGILLGTKTTIPEVAEDDKEDDD